MDKDLHGYQNRLDNLLRNISESQIDEESKTLLINYERDLLLYENLSVARRERMVAAIFWITRCFIKKPLKQVNVEDVKGVINTIEKVKYSPWTRALYKIAIRKFFRWLAYGSDKLREYPRLVSWIKVHVRKRDQPRVQASAIITEEEIQKLIESSRSSRDRAFVALLYELGARISEIGNLAIKDLSRDQYSYTVDLFGKTGHRTPRVVLADPYVTEWLNHHPMRNDPKAPLWVVKDAKGNYVKMNYSTLRVMLRRIVGRSGIIKRIYPHLFRHTRVTHLLRNKQINEAQAKVYFGWTPESGMLSEYDHLVSGDVNDTILQMHGIHVDKNEAKQSIKICPRCKKINSNDAVNCIHCSSILDEKTAFRQDDEQKQIDNVMNVLLKDPKVQEILMQKLDEIRKQELQREQQSNVITNSTPATQ
ncbi:tyrosine-type recombinase/integrase [Candidatus Woesearchaeota archaeon]|nr:tyrosine-type recombinase/integrase [Candidatus Woesearchaeota archaeon]